MLKNHFARNFESVANCFVAKYRNCFVEEMAEESLRDLATESLRPSSLPPPPPLVVACRQLSEGGRRWRWRWRGGDSVNTVEQLINGVYSAETRLNQFVTGGD